MHGPHSVLTIHLQEAQIGLPRGANPHCGGQRWKYDDRSLNGPSGQPMSWVAHACQRYPWCLLLGRCEFGLTHLCVPPLLLKPQHRGHRFERGPGRSIHAVVGRRCTKTRRRLDQAERHTLALARTRPASVIQTKVSMSTGSKPTNSRGLAGTPPATLQPQPASGFDAGPFRLHYDDSHGPLDAFGADGAGSLRSRCRRRP